MNDSTQRRLSRLCYGLAVLAFALALVLNMQAGKADVDRYVDNLSNAMLTESGDYGLQSQPSAGGSGLRTGAYVAAGGGVVLLGLAWALRPPKQPDSA